MGFIGSLLNFLIVLCSVFLICLVLIQRGRGGGLAGAFGGLGGSSAFGTKAGDVFTRVTVVTAVIWFLLAMALVIINNRGRTSAFDLGVAEGGSREVVPTATGTPGGDSTQAGATKPTTEPSTPSKTSENNAGLPAALTDDVAKPANPASPPASGRASDAAPSSAP